MRFFLMRMVSIWVLSSAMVMAEAIGPDQFDVSGFKVGDAADLPR